MERPRSSTSKLSRSRVTTALVWLEALLAVGALAGGVGLIVGGVDLGTATTRLPFGSATFAGFALILINGVLPLTVAAAAVRRRSWAGVGHLVVGVALMTWIVVQVATLGPPIVWLQVVYFLWGMAITVLARRLRR